jgi:hypothetical protein
MITAERAREVFNYEPLTGVLLWRISTGKRVHVGDEAGHISEGYRRVNIDGRSYRAHNIIWLIMTGKWPLRIIDHRDLDGTNNVWLNLRQASESQNCQNRRRFKNNTSGEKGIDSIFGLWRARIQINGLPVYLGLFEERPAAIAAYRAAALKLHGDFARV